MQQTDISIVIVNYNVRDFLLQCLRSIEQAAEPDGINIEVIVVDNNSKDGSVEFLEPKFPSVKFISLDENIGFGRANNIGIEKSNGEYVLILNPDTILSEDTLSVMKQYMDDNTEVGMAGCKLLNPDGSFQVACRRGFPTPWASFTKLFGLQKLFPKSKLFARYNQTYLSVDKTYYIDALMGAFMFCRRDALEQSGGFDEQYFMYGEDLDLCYNFHKLGWKVAYVHSTSIIHYKGESTRRSSINEVGHFYEAMKIFARKYYGRSTLFLSFLKLGIMFRAFLAYMKKYRRSIFFMILDTLILNLSLLAATKIRFGEFLNFPPYAYPTVFIVPSVIVIIAMIAVGEYFEQKPGIIRAFTGFMISFFVLSSLTYFFKEFAFSRGILLMTIGLTFLISALLRGIVALFDKFAGKESDRRLLIVGSNSQTGNIINSLRQAGSRNVDIVGLVNVGSNSFDNTWNLPVVGNFDYLPKIIEDNKIREVIICDRSLPRSEILRTLTAAPKLNVRFHFANEYEEFIASRIINEVSGIDIAFSDYKLSVFRYKLAKRLADITISIFLLTIGLPMVYLLFPNAKETIKNLFRVLKGQKSFVGYYPVAGEQPSIGKPGIIGLAHISRPERLPESAIVNLNNYYIRHFSLSLDADIFLKFIFRKRSGE